MEKKLAFPTTTIVVNSKWNIFRFHVFPLAIMERTLLLAGGWNEPGNIGNKSLKKKRKKLEKEVGDVKREKDV